MSEIGPAALSARLSDYPMHIAPTTPSESSLPSLSVGPSSASSPHDSGAATPASAFAPEKPSFVRTASQETLLTQAVKQSAAGLNKSAAKVTLIDYAAKLRPQFEAPGRTKKEVATRAANQAMQEANDRGQTITISPNSVAGRC